MNDKRLPSLLAALLLAGVSLAQAADAKGQDSKRSDAEPKPYPLDTCVVSGEAFGEAMGEPITFVHEGREVMLCCKSCRKDFDADTAKFVAKIDAAAKLVKPYPLKVCLVSGEALGGMGKPVVFVRERQEIKLCCKSCKKDFNKDAGEYLAKLKRLKGKEEAAGHGSTHR